MEFSARHSDQKMLFRRRLPNYASNSRNYEATLKGALNASPLIRADAVIGVDN